MAIVTGTVQTFSMVGIREKLSDVIMNIAPMEVPFTSLCRKATTQSRTPEWQRDTLRKPSGVNAQIEGNDITAATTGTGGQPDRLKNIVQLFDETVIVSDTAQKVDAAGRANELKYQTAKSAKAVKRDIEMSACGNYASALGNSTTAGKLGGVETWLVTNTSRGAGGANGGYSGGVTTLATDGTGRAITETLLKGVIKTAWDNGGEPETVMVTGKHKQDISAFTGIATQYNAVDGKAKIVIQGAIDIYRSDFGMHKIVPNRFMGASASRTPNATTGLYTTGAGALVLTPSTWGMTFLQPFTTIPLARTGHAEKRLLKAELTLVCKEERANGIVADLT